MLTSGTLHWCNVLPANHKPDTRASISNTEWCYRYAVKCNNWPRCDRLSGAVAATTRMRQLCDFNPQHYLFHKFNISRSLSAITTRNFFFLTSVTFNFNRYIPASKLCKQQSCTCWWAPQICRLHLIYFLK